MKYLLWDFDGTLAHRPGQWTDTVMAVLRGAGLADGVDREVVRPFMNAGFPWHEPERLREPGQTSDAWWEALVPVFARAFEQVPNVDAGMASVLARKVRSTYLDSSAWIVYDDVIPTLRRLSSLQWRHIVLSNHVPELPALIHSLGLGDHFDAIYTSAATGVEKPHPRAFRPVLDTLPPGAVVWMIGDNPIADAKGAEVAGIPAILVRQEARDGNRICGGLADVVDIVERHIT
jgi:putative hydrolase of the HAD superfamily